MKCENCGVSVFECHLVRINELGVPGIFWCESCLKKNEPELYLNTKEDQSDLERNAGEIFYQSKS